MEFILTDHGATTVAQRSWTDKARQVGVWLGLALVMLQIVHYMLGIAVTLGMISTPVFIPIIILLHPFWMTG